MNYPVFSHETRRQAIDKLRAEAKPAIFDAVVVGGGIVGAGLARELAIRGLKALVVEKGDYASGTSSRSSKLIHGGLRYLEMFDFHLVFESLAERHWLLSTHPHLVQPLEFNLPIYARGDAPPGARSTGALGIGLWLYDALSLFRTPFFHGKHSAGDCARLFPKIRSQGLKGSYYYADAMMLDDEVVLETILDAVRRGATALNYVRAEKVAEKGSDGLYDVTLTDTLDDQAKPVAVKAREVIACVGPWTEAFGSRVARGSARKLKPSKGVHLIVPWSRLPLERCLVMYHPDGRIIFAIPRKDLGAGAEQVIIGTTDSAEHGDLDRIQANRADIDYLLHVLEQYFPDAKLTEKDITMTYAGVRPLLDTGAKSEAKTSREHEIWRNDAGIVFMAGGKYTTFRKISQEIADFAFPKTSKHAHDDESKSVLSEPADYAARLEGQPIWGRFTDQWVKWKLAHHAPCTLEDLMFRRMPIWMGGRKAFEQALGPVGELARAHFKWSAEELARQKAQALRSLEERLRF
ncbi:MAG: glycerol-3-phosphate dehydrogenase/oxidase [Deltaproteobacteria bacterium]|nr:glycerol-3-phosphate dehydrogenase/oxidase [Deltaproteobacteria bacterium]